MAVVEGKLHDRKELWFHIWYAKTVCSWRRAKLGSTTTTTKTPTNLHI